MYFQFGLLKSDTKINFSFLCFKTHTLLNASNEVNCLMYVNFHLCHFKNCQKKNPNVSSQLQEQHKYIIQSVFHIF